MSVWTWNGKKFSQLFDGYNYDGEKQTGEFNSWNTFGADPNYVVKGTYKTLIDRLTTLYYTSPFARANINKPLAYSIGEGIVFQSHINGEPFGLTKEQANEFSKAFSYELHVEKLAANYYQKQPILAREAKITGDSLLFFDYNDPDGKPFDLIVAGGHDIDCQKEADNVQLGIQTDKYLRREGIHRVDENGYMAFKDDDGDQNVIQLLFQERAGQLRGYGTNFAII